VRRCRDLGLAADVEHVAAALVGEGGDELVVVAGRPSGFQAAYWGGEAVDQVGDELAVFATRMAPGGLGV
jgi:hypothetical protein